MKSWPVAISLLILAGIGGQPALASGEYRCYVQNLTGVPQSFLIRREHWVGVHPWRRRETSDFRVDVDTGPKPDSFDSSDDNTDPKIIAFGMNEDELAAMELEKHGQPAAMAAGQCYSVQPALADPKRITVVLTIFPPPAEGPEAATVPQPGHPANGDRRRSAR